MLSFEQILQRIESEISKLQYIRKPQSLYDPIYYILSLGGKRIRPALTLIACNMYSESIESAIKPALGLEVFHNFTLLHDDLMDNADKRRGKPTVHKVWNDNSAILSGDAMLILAYKLIGETEKDKLKEILDIFTQTSLEICEGQQYDMIFESRLEVCEAEYIEMIRLKTAVLLACSLKIGAIIGSASEKDANHLYEFGINIGLMFQLKDDLLDVYGNTNSFGKNLGGDIACNKKTFLLVSALMQANKEQSTILNEWLNKKEYDISEKIAAISQIYDNLNLRKFTEEKMETYYQAALQHLEKLDISHEKTELLQAVCHQLMYRNV